MRLDRIRRNLAERLGGQDFGRLGASYKFEQIKKAVMDAEKSRPDRKLINLGVGEPEDRADERVIDMLAQEVWKPENRGYADNGILEFQQAAAEYMNRVFGVNHLDPQSEVAHSIGTKSALSILPACFINPGDITLMPVPGYPILGTHTRYLGGEVYPLPLVEEHAYLPDLDAIPRDILRRAKLLYLNYPHNPTGSSATEPFFERVVHFAKRHHITVVHDAAYAALTMEGARPLSFLSIPGAKEIGIELHSLSKSHNMTGWRIGFAAGNPLAIEAFRDAKNNYDSGQFIAIQKAAVHALQQPDIIQRNIAKYARRLDMLSGLLRERGFPVRKSEGTFFLYTRAPKGIAEGQSFATAADFAAYLILDMGIVTVPWDDTERGIRLSVTFEAPTKEAELQIMQELSRRLREAAFVF